MSHTSAMDAAGLVPFLRLFLRRKEPERSVAHSSQPGRPQKKSMR